MLSINIATDIRGALRGLDNLARSQVPFATARSLTATGQDVRDALGIAVRDGFDRATVFITRSPFSTVASKAKPEVTVGIRDGNNGRASPADYVREHFSGGARGHKPMEKAMQAIGALPAGWRAVPGAGMKLDVNGNPNRKAVAEILGAVRTGMRVHSGRGRRAATQAYFVRAVGAGDKRTAHLAPGIYRRTSRGGETALVPVFLFVDEASYQAVIDLPRLAADVIGRKFAGHFEAALAQAIRTAR